VTFDPPNFDYVCKLNPPSIFSVILDKSKVTCLARDFFIPKCPRMLLGAKVSQKIKVNKIKKYKIQNTKSIYVVGLNYKLLHVG
jgi:hypothetical protein